MPLRIKMLVIVSAVAVLFGGVDYVVQRHWLYPSFVALECEQARKNVTRGVVAIEREIHHLDVLCHDWAARDDTYEFAANHNPAYAESNLTQPTFQDNDLNLIYVLDAARRVVWGKTVDLDTEDSISLRAFASPMWPQNHPLLQHDLENTPLECHTVSGLLTTERGPMLVASRPILKSGNKGPVQGSIIMGRFLNDAAVARLAEQTRVVLNVIPVASENLSTADAESLLQLNAGAPHVLREGDDERLHGMTIFKDIQGNTALLVRTTTPRDITARGREALNFSLASTCVIATALLITLYVTLKKTVVGPIVRLTRHAVAVGSSDDLSIRFNSARTDEIGTLGREFDRMVEQLADARHRLLQQSFESGLAEMASDVLHNVRNAMTPILVDIQDLSLQLGNTESEQIDQARNELSDPSISPTRRGDLHRFLELAHSELASVVDNARGTLDQVAGRADQIDQFLEDQETISRAGRPLESVELAPLVREAAALLPESLQECLHVDVDSTLADVGTVMTHRASILQTMVDLLANAAEPYKKANRPSETVRVSAKTIQDGENEMVEISIWAKDQGSTPENIERIFERDYPRKNGSTRGSGLHRCANTVASLNGRIYAEHATPGSALCIRVQIPRSPFTKLAPNPEVARHHG